jgi:hypothetical protein
MASRERRLGALALAALMVFLFPRALLLGEAFYERDLAFDWVTQVEVFVRSVAQGSWPLWDNSIAFGQPLLADPSAQLLYPPTWLNLLMRPWTYYTLFAAGHLLWAGLGTAALARRLGASRGAALAAGALFMGSGPLLSLVNVYHHFASAAWIPWVALGAQVTAETRRLRHALLWTLAIVAQIFAGSADMCAAAQLLSAALVVRQLSWREPLSAVNRRLVGISAMALPLALGLTAVQWLPTLEQARRSLRWAMPDSIGTAWSVTPLALLQVVLPALLPDTLTPAAQAAFAPSGGPFLASLYLGLPALALAAAALAGSSRSPRFTLAAVALASILYTLGPATPFHRLATTLLPALRIFRYPSKAMVLAALCLALLAGLGLDAWKGDAPRRRWWAVVVAPLAAGVALAVTVVIATWIWTPAHVLRPQALGLAVGAGAGALALALAVARRAGPAVAAMGVAALVFANQGLNRTTPKAVLDQRPPVLDAIAPLPAGAAAHPLGGPRLYVFDYLRDPLRSRRYLHRDEAYLIRVPPGMDTEQAQVLAQRLYPFPPSAGRWGFEGSFDPDFRGLDPSYLAQLSQLAVQAEGTPLHTWLLRVGAVGHVVALHSEGLTALEEVAALPTLFPEPARAFRVPRPRPRAYLVSGARPGGESSALVDAAADMDPEREALIAGLPAPVAPDPAFTGAVPRFEVRPDRVSAQIEASAPAWLVMVDTFDPGWLASVDGVPAPLLRANVAFRAVRVAQGPHRVELVYRPRGVSVGLLVSGVFAAALAGLAWASRR